jgi:hypothetical protein
MEPSRTVSHSGAFLRSKRFRRVALAGGLVLLAAVVILVVSALSTPKQTPESLPAKVVAPVTDAPTTDYNLALDAAASGDTTKAVTLLGRVPKSDPNYSAAQQKIVVLTAAAQPSGPASSGSSGGTASETSQSPAPVDTAYLRAVADLVSLLPTSMPGYRVSPPENQVTIALTTAEPAAGSPASGKLTMVSLTVHDQRTPAAAAQFSRRVSSKVYPKNADAKVKVGSRVGYYGTDGRLAATVSFARGRYAFELIATVIGGDVNAFKALCVSAATAFPASRN